MPVRGEMLHYRGLQLMAILGRFALIWKTKSENGSIRKPLLFSGGPLIRHITITSWLSSAQKTHRISFNDKDRKTPQK